MPEVERNTVQKENKENTEAKATAKSIDNEKKAKQGASRFAMNDAEKGKTPKNIIRNSVEMIESVSKNIKEASEKIDPGSVKKEAKKEVENKPQATKSTVGKKVVLASKVLKNEMIEHYRTKGEQTKLYRGYQKRVNSMKELMDKVKLLERENKLAYEKVRLADSKERDAQVLTDTVASSKKTFKMKTQDGNEVEVYAGTEASDVKREEEEKKAAEKESRSSSGGKRNMIVNVAKDLAVQYAVKQPIAWTINMLNPLKYNTVIDGRVPTR